jgi:hypothetical protein
MSVAAIARNTPLKLVGRQVVHELSEDGLTGIHPSLSEMAAVWVEAVSGPPSARKISNRKISTHPQAADFTVVIARQKTLAGQ